MGALQLRASLGYMLRPQYTKEQLRASHSDCILGTLASWQPVSLPPSLPPPNLFPSAMFTAALLHRPYLFPCRQPTCLHHCPTSLPLRITMKKPFPWGPASPPSTSAHTVSSGPLMAYRIPSLRSSKISHCLPSSVALLWDELP